MKVLELFAGTRSIGKAFEAHGHQVFSVEWDKSFENIDLYEDVLKVTPEEIVKRFGRPDVIWASPDCMSGLPRHTVTYCQHGDTRMKPTDIWTNHPDPEFKPPCHNGDPCHTPAPRGAKTGTQGLSGSRERSIIPAALCEHIVEICESGDPDWGRH